MDKIDKILITTDFSETSRAAFGAARRMAECFGAKLLVAYVEDDRLPPLVVEYMAIGLEDIRQRQQERAREQLVAFVREQLGPQAEVQLEVPMGVPHVEIVRLAEEREVDLIVMATHGRGFISHAFMGSTTERVLRHAPCPVLVVRDREAS